MTICSQNDAKTRSNIDDKYVKFVKGVTPKLFFLHDQGQQKSMTKNNANSMLEQNEAQILKHNMEATIRQKTMPIPLKSGSRQTDARKSKNLLTGRSLRRHLLVLFPFQAV